MMKIPDKNKDFSRRKFLKSATLFSLSGILSTYFKIKKAIAGQTTISLSGTSSGFSPYIDDVFSTYLYDGQASGTQVITNNVNLSLNGGMVWLKNRTNSVGDHNLWDSQRGLNGYLSTSTTSAQTNTSSVGPFNSNGFSIGGTGTIYYSSAGDKFVSWTFRKAPKFFDVVSYSGDNSGTRTLTHSLGVQPGMIICRAVSGGSYWFVKHCSATSSKILYLNTSDVETTADSGAIPSIGTAANFSVGALLNGTGTSYVAYLFAHDSDANGIIQCGSYVGSGATTTVTLGWEPQFLMIKKAIDPAANGLSGWVVIDNMRGLGKNYDNALQANTSSVEAGAVSVSGAVDLQATGFRLLNANGALNVNTDTYIYVAIRRPNKPPTSGTQVYNAIVYTGNAVDGRAITGAGFPPDMGIFSRKSGTGTDVHDLVDRIRGKAYLKTHANSSELTNLSLAGTSLQDGFTVGANGLSYSNENSVPFIANMFRRAPGFFDIVAYTGNGVGARSIAHSLGVLPGMIIAKALNSTESWMVVHQGTGGSSPATGLILNSTIAGDGYPAAMNVIHESTTFRTDRFGYSIANTAGINYIAYLFATLPGISKVGSYTGSASGTVVVPCGFTGSARFVLIKRTDSTGDWIMVDSTRGSGCYLTLNTTNAEVATSVLTFTTGGFTTAATGVITNISGATYIFLAIA